MVIMKELEFFKDKILMGFERRSVEIDNKNKIIIVYYEFGYVIIVYYIKDVMFINKVIIMFWGLIFGYVFLLFENDRWNEIRV